MSFVGFPGDDVRFFFETITAKAQCLTGPEVELSPGDDRFSSRFHFGRDYNPNLSNDGIGNKGLSRPPGLSGSTVWNTCFVEAKVCGIAWTPEMAKVTGAVWGWPSNFGCLVATGPSICAASCCPRSRSPAEWRLDRPHLADANHATVDQFVRESDPRFSGRFLNAVGKHLDTGFLEGSGHDGFQWIVRN